MQFHLDGRYSPLTYLRLKVLAVRKKEEELPNISMVDIALPLLVTDSPGILAA
jgi:hypothetical protein